MNDQPKVRHLHTAPVGYRELKTVTARDRLCLAAADAIRWTVFIGVAVAMPVVVALWRWAL